MEHTVLYIEDNIHNRIIVRRILESKGYTVIEATDGISGLAMVEELKPALVLLDIGLPRMDGMQVASRLKANAELANIPIIALTASAMRGDRERFLAAGCNDYLSKPVRALELLEKIQLYLPNGNGQH